jgi:hypothetical protein
MYLQKVGNKQKNFFVDVLEVTDENSKIRIRIHKPKVWIRGSGPRFHDSATLKKTIKQRLPTINTEDKQTHVPVPYHIRQIAEKKICIYKKKNHHYFNVVMPQLAFIQSKVIILYLYRSCEFRSRWHNCRIRNKKQTYFLKRIRMSNLRNTSLVINLPLSYLSRVPAINVKEAYKHAQTSSQVYFVGTKEDHAH